MKVYDTPDIRNLAVIGHGDSGKTTLVSAMLFVSGAEKRLGRVEEGTTITDYDEEEVARKISLQTALAHVEWKNHKINLIDCPGYAAFVADAKSGLAVADAALVAVEAVAGVQVLTERTFKFAAERGLPVVFVLTKMERERASFDRALQSIRDRFGRSAVPIQIPIGAEDEFRGVVDLLSMKALTFDEEGTGKMTSGEIPADLADRAAESRSTLVEMVAETDDALMETFFEAGNLDAEQLAQGLGSAVLQRKLFPVACTSALPAGAVQPLLDLAVDVLPSPADRGEAVGTKPGENSELRRPVAPDEPVSAFVFKTVADPYAGRLSLFRVMTGTLRADSGVINVRTGSSERMGGIAILQGKKLEPTSELHAGDLGVVAKLKETQTGDTLADAAHPIQYPPIQFPAPAISFAVEPKSKGDEEKISTALSRLMEEDPVLKVARDPRTHEMLVSGTGQVHVEVIIAKMKRKFGVEATLKQPKVPYLETITRKVPRVQGRHKKQTGGRGQFGDCWIEMEPLPRGGGFEFVDKIFGGAIPQNFRPAVEKGIREASARGWLAGHPVVDFRVTLVDGSYHTVDSSEMAFKVAGSLAFKAAMDKAAPTILEPVMSVEIVAPEECMGDIMGDLSSRRGKPQGMESQGPYQVIKALVPLAEMLTYASTLKAITSDRGTYHMEFSGYEEVPAQIREKIIAESQKAKQTEE